MYINRRFIYTKLDLFTDYKTLTNRQGRNILPGMCFNEMDISSVFGKSCPQKVTLDCNIVTVTGELISKGTDIFVLVCSNKLVTCKSTSSYQDKRQTLYLNVENEVNLKDIHCDGEIYRTADNLYHASPRYFSCTDDTFAFDNERDQTVKIEAGHKLELLCKQNERCNKKSPMYSNVTPFKSSNIVCCILPNEGGEVQIPPSCKTSFKSITDTNNYKAEDLINRISLPRRVQICDEDLANLAEVVIGSKDIEIQSKTKTFVLLFTLDYAISDQSQSSCVQIKENIKCCEFVDPSTIKLKRRLDNTQIGEQFDSTLCLEVEERGRKRFSLLGRRTFVPVSRLCSGRQEYIAMEKPQSVKTLNSGTSKNDSGFIEAKVRSNTFPKAKTRRSNDLSASDDSDDYVDISLEVESVPTIPDKLHCDVDVLKNNTAEATEAFLSDTNNITLDADKHKEGCLSENPTSSETEKGERKSEKGDSECEVSCMSGTQLAELLRKCKLVRFAEVCVEELVDGELFLSLTEDILQDDPFNLKKFEILKVNKIKGGWKPNL